MVMSLGQYDVPPKISTKMLPNASLQVFLMTGNFQLFSDLLSENLSLNRTLSDHPCSTDRTLFNFGPRWGPGTITTYITCRFLTSSKHSSSLFLEVHHMPAAGSPHPYYTQSPRYSFIPTSSCLKKFRRFSMMSPRCKCLIIPGTLTGTECLHLGYGPMFVFMFPIFLITLIIN